MTKIEYVWSLELYYRKGHRYFRDHSTGRLAVCDSSGKTPEESDDGVLWVDDSKPIIIGSHGASVPVKNEKGECAVVIEPVNNAMSLAVVYGFMIRYEAVEMLVPIQG